jgi:hypothetical protein
MSEEPKKEPIKIHDIIITNLTEKVTLYLRDTLDRPMDSTLCNNEADETVYIKILKQAGMYNIDTTAEDLIEYRSVLVDCFNAVLKGKKPTSTMHFKGEISIEDILVTLTPEELKREHNKYSQYKLIKLALKHAPTKSGYVKLQYVYDYFNYVNEKWDLGWSVSNTGNSVRREINTNYVNSENVEDFKGTGVFERDAFRKGYYRLKTIKTPQEV